MGNLKDKFKEDYRSYLELCKEYNENPRSNTEDFYKHRNWMLRNK